MADKSRNTQPSVQAPKKADLILQRQREAAIKQDEVLSQSKLTVTRINTALEQIAATRQDVSRAIKQETALQGSLQDDYQSLKQELRFLAMQSENIFASLSEKVQELSDLISGGRVRSAAEDEIAAVAAAPADIEIDYDYLAEKVAEKMPVPEVRTSEGVVVARQESIDYDLLVDKLIARLPVQEVTPVAATAEIDYDLLADRLARRLPSQEIAVASAAPLPVNVQVSDRSFDYDYLADKIISQFPAQEVISPDYIASKVAEQIVIPEISAEVDSATVADLVAEKIGNVAGGDIDYDYLAAKVAQQIELPEVQNYTAAAVSGGGVNYEINEDELADAIALKVGSLKPEDFEILVDDEGCQSISKEILERLDYDAIAGLVAEKLKAAMDSDEEEEPDYDDMALRISEKITVAGVNEDVIADKAAAALSNYLPEFDTDEIADKVAEQVISALPASLDHDAITSTIANRIIESQQDNDYEIVIDDDGVEKMSDSVSEKVYATNDERFNAIDKEIAEIKEILLNLDVKPVVTVVSAPAEQQPEEETVEEEAEEIEEIQAAADEEPEEELVTVSDVIQEEYVAEPAEETVEEAVEEAEETVPPTEEPSVVINVAAPTDDEDDEDSDSGDDEGDEDENGVDFANMMRYNRSFIARIIQSPDEVKKYYGEVRNALLSYRRVNSNIAWGAERFHKGRETIARFKIRGKTLVLYLALNPQEHEYSVYHWKDVSNNKSLHGAPMMIKIKSPRGVKKAVRLVDEMLEMRDGIKRHVPERDYAAMYPYESMEELIEDGLVKDVNKK